MASRHSLERSSLLVSLPVIAVSGIACLVTAFYGVETLSVYLLVIFLFSFASRLWAAFSSSCMEASLDLSSRGVFPGENVEIELRVRNGKFLPVAWLDLYMPIPRREALVPKDTRPTESWERSGLEAIGASTRIVGTRRLGRMLWYEEAVYSISMEARCRGVCTLDDWRLSTGDGFGLSESDIRLAKGTAIAVYPQILDVDASPFLRNLWNSSTGSRGVMEDFTVIRSTRDYQAGDSVRNINWRLLARALPLTVNIYEEILPKSIHMIFDGESYSEHKDEMEKALSVIASELLVLRDHDVRAVLSLPEGRYGGACTVRDDLAEALFHLSSYEPLEDRFDYNEVKRIIQVSKFDVPSILASATECGHFFHFTYDAAVLSSKDILSSLGEEKVTVVSSVNTPAEGEYSHICLDDIVRGGNR